MQGMLLMCFFKESMKIEEIKYKQEKYSTIILKLFSLIIGYKTLNIFTHRKSTRCINLVYYLFELPET